MKIGIRNHNPTPGEALRGQRLAWLRLSFRFVVGLVGTIGFALPETVLARVADPTIKVQVDNYSQASSAILDGAEREAGRIFGEAGLKVVWLDCPAGHSAKVPQGPCQGRLEPTDISLRILSEPTQNRFQTTVFGFAVHPVLASVYYDYVLRRAQSDGAGFEVPIILGCVIAHEIGHLLLGSNSHSSSGIMQPRWERKQIRQAVMGALLFVPEQAKLIRAETQSRMSLQTAGLKERPMGAAVCETDSGSITIRIYEALAAIEQRRLTPVELGSIR